MRRYSPIPLLLAALLGLSACNECDFFERCNGNVLEICGEGADQQVGRKIRSIPCEAPNAACVEVNDQKAQCVASPAEACDPAAFAATCDGDMLRWCPTDIGHILADDCAKFDKVCVTGGTEGAHCEAPAK